MYIVLEGIVGSGKTTQVKRLGEYFHSVIASGAWRSSDKKDSLFFSGLLRSSQWRKKEYPEVILVREPGTTPISEDIRYLAQGKEWESEKMHPLTNAYLYAAARVQTLQTIVKPALEWWDIVISDRSFLSSCAIQWEAQWLGIDTILRINREAIWWILPDLVIYLDIDIDLALSRTSDHWRDKFEKEGREFYSSILRGYDKCEKLEIMKNRFFRIDANGSEEEVFEKIIQYINNSITNNMTLEQLIILLKDYFLSSPEDREATMKIIEWIEQYREFAFVKDNLEGHLTGSMIITNPERTKVLLMLHKKFQRWQQFGWHCDGEIDVQSVAIREFHEESGILDEPEISDAIFHVDVHNVPVDAKGRPAHFHFDILYLGSIPENTPFVRQESEVDDIRWFTLDEALEKNDEHLMSSAIAKIRNII